MYKGCELLALNWATISAGERPKLQTCPCPPLIAQPASFQGIQYISLAV